MGINCPVQVGSIVDDRPKKDDMGIISQRSIHASNIEPWLGEAFSNLQANYSLGRSVNEVSARRTPIVLNAKLKKLYAHTVAVSISANVVLAVGFAIDGQVLALFGHRLLGLWVGHRHRVGTLRIHHIAAL